MTPGRPDLRVFRDSGELARAAAEDFCRRALGAVRPGRRFACALPGGSTPRAMFEAMADDAWTTLPEETRRSVHFFWGDERAVPPGHPDSNFRTAHELFLRRAALPEVNIHRIPAELGAERAADAYELELRRFFGLASAEWPVFDLIYLGLGEDGHTASIFPGSEAITETRRLVAAVKAGPAGSERITLTLPVINSASCIIFMVAGAKKARILRQVLAAAGPARELPASLVRPEHGRLLWLADRAAASLLPAGGSAA